MSALSNVEVGAVQDALESSNEYLSFRLATEEYGIDILRVQEICSYLPPTRIVGAPECVRGVLNPRGVIVPIVDLRLRLGIDAPFDASTVTVVLNIDGRTIGAVVDSVSDVIALVPDQIKKAPHFTDTAAGHFITGLGAIRQGEQERMLILVDIRMMMAELNHYLSPADLGSS